MEKKFDSRLIQLRNSKIRKFGFSFAAGMAILCGVSIWRHFPLAITIISGSLSVIHLLFALICRKCLLPTFKIMNIIGHILGNVLTTIIFTIVFFLIFTPMSLILRLAGKDHIKMNLQKPGWITVPDKDNDPKKVERLF